MTEPLLAVRGVKTFYGNIMALKGVDLDVHDGEIVTLIGTNGAGKSTLMMTIFGNPRASEGSILFDGRDITRHPSTTTQVTWSASRPPTQARGTKHPAPDGETVAAVKPQRRDHDLKATGTRPVAVRCHHRSPVTPSTSRRERLVPGPVA